MNEELQNEERCKLCVEEYADPYSGLCLECFRKTLPTITDERRAAILRQWHTERYSHFSTRFPIVTKVRVTYTIDVLS